MKNQDWLTEKRIAVVTSIIKNKNYFINAERDAVCLIQKFAKKRGQPVTKKIALRILNSVIQKTTPE
jgi:hypothetical protein